MRRKLNGRPSCKFTLHAVVHEFLEKSSMHGAQYLTRTDLNPTMRAIWFASLLLGTWGAWVTSVAYISSANRPVDVTILKTNLHEESVPFPAVVVCPLSSIRRTIAVEYIQKFLQASNLTELPVDEIMYVLKMLQSFSFPAFKGNMGSEKLYKDDFALKQYFEYINITDLALEDLLGSTTDLAVYKTIFNSIVYIRHLERASCCVCTAAAKTYLCPKEIKENEVSAVSALAGFCMKLISRTNGSQTYKTFLGPEPDYLFLFSMNDSMQMANESLPECQVQDNAYHFPRSLKFAVKSAIPEEMVMTHKWFRGYYVNAFPPTSLPKPSNGYYISGRGGGLDLQVSRVITKAESSLIDLPLDSRNCYFPSEKKKSEVVQSTIYSSDVCILECRLHSLAKDCNCRPYMVKVHPHTRFGQYAICNFYKMKCAVEAKVKMQVISAPNPKWGSELADDGLKCHGCLPACVSDVAEVLPLRTEPDILFRSTTFEGTPASNDSLSPNLALEGLNVSIIQVSRNNKRPNNVYLRRERPDLVDKLAICGGIAGLFLGIGILTIFEGLYFFVRGIAVFLQWWWAGQQTKRVLPLNLHAKNRVLVRKF